jgi:hypothetical protein
MPAKLTPEEKIRRGEAELSELRTLAAEIIKGKYEGNERGAAYRHLNSLALHVKHHVSRLKVKRRKDYDEKVARKAISMINEADELYERAWKAHH